MLVSLELFSRKQYLRIRLGPGWGAHRRSPGPLAPEVSIRYCEDIVNGVFLRYLFGKWWGIWDIGAGFVDADLAARVGSKEQGVGERGGLDRERVRKGVLGKRRVLMMAPTPGQLRWACLPRSAGEGGLAYGQAAN